MNTSSFFTGSKAEIPLWFEQFDIKQIRQLRIGQPFVDFDAADNCRLYITTMKAMKFLDDIPSSPADNLKDQYMLVFDLKSIHDASEICLNPELVGGPLMLELKFTFPLKPVTQLIVLGKRRCSVAVEKFGVVEKKSKMDSVSKR